MTALQLIIRREYLQDVSSRSFWSGTFALPILFIAFGIFIGVLTDESSTTQNVASLGKPIDEDMSGINIFAMLVSMFLSLFLFCYGAMIFNKVKAEKTSRIMEMLASTVSGRTMMMGKIISVALTGLTQILVWAILIITAGVVLLTAVGQVDIIYELLDKRILIGFIYAIIYFIGGYLLFGSLYATIGAMTDRDNENQGYMTIVTFIIMSSFYISIYAIDNPESALSVWCAYIPFTSPGIGTMLAISGTFNIWQSLISIVILYGCAWLSITFAGKVYTSAMLLNGTKFSPRDILTFLRAK